MESDVEESDQDSSAIESKEENIFPPLVKKLLVDHDLELNPKDFGQSIKQLLLKHGAVGKSTSEYLFNAPPFPTPGNLAKFASLAYQDNTNDRDNEKRLQLPDGWKLLTIAFNNKTTNGYYGAAYWHPDRQHVVIAHRGTVLTKLGADWADINGVFFNNFVPQMNSACTFANAIIQELVDIQKDLEIKFEIFFTGHSLGGWLAQITTFTIKHLESVENNFRKAVNKDTSGYHAHTIVFDSPGCREMLREMKDKFDVRYEGQSTYLNTLDITSYLSAPNMINTCNTHIGTVYRIFTDLSDMNIIQKHTLAYHLFTHSMQKILEVFDPSTGHVGVGETGIMKLQTVVDWPRGEGLGRGEEYKEFFEWAEHLNNYHPEINESFKEITQGHYPIRYQTKQYDPSMTSISVFTQKEKEFLETYQGLRQNKLSDFYDFFAKKETEAEMKNKVRKKLETFIIEKNSTFHVPNPKELSTLIPFVKRLVHTFITDKAQNNSSAESVAAQKLYQTMTSHYLSELENQFLDFKGNFPTLSDFLDNYDQQIWQLQVKEEKTWVGMKHVYRSLQRISEHGGFSNIVMELKQLVHINGLIHFDRVLDFPQNTHILLIDCKTTKNIDYSGAKKFFEELFSLLNNRHKLKIIMVAQEGTEYTKLFREQVTQINDENIFLATKYVDCTWNDLTPRSKKNLFEKEITFQGKIIPLNKLIDKSDQDFLEQISPAIFIDDIIIGNELTKYSGYDESYYIPRSFYCHTIINQNILDDKTNFPDLMAYTEVEFNRLCEKNRVTKVKKNVHLFQKSSGNLIWKKSQGSLSALRPYVDKNTTLSISEEEIVQNNAQRIVIISGAPGIGKSTVLDHLSVLTKNEFPSYWVNRLNLNEHKEQLEKKKDILANVDSDVISFLSADLLQLKTPLELKLFEHAIRKTGKMCLFLDGFDEISPNHTDTVLDFVQKLRETSLGKLVISSRLYLQEKLENELQQFSYTLKVFSDSDQVDFLTRYWQQNLDLPDGKNEKLNNYSKSLIKAVGKSIKDDEHMMIGIPLQTKMLADLYKESARKVVENETFSELSETFSLLGLYGQFIDNKLTIYGKDKMELPIGVGNKKVDKLFKKEEGDILEDHQHVALKALFNKQELILLNPGHESKSIDTVRILEVGIVQNINNNTEEFIHRTFAEYFVASFLVSQLLEQRKPSKEQSQFLFEVILIDNEYETLRAFLNSMLVEHTIPINTITEHGRFISDLLSKNNILQDRKETAFHVACSSNLFAILTFIISVIQKDPTTLNIFFLLANKEGRIPFHYVCKHGKPDIITALLAPAKVQFTADTVKETFLKKDKQGRTPLHYAIQYQKTDVIIEILECLKDNFGLIFMKKILLTEDIDGLIPFHFALQNNTFDILIRFLDNIKNNLGNERVKKMFFTAGNHKHNIPLNFAMAKGSFDSVCFLLDYFQHNFDAETLKKMFLQKDEFGNTLLHYVVDINNCDLTTKYCDFFKANFEHLFMKEILLEKNNDGLPPLHHALQNQNFLDTILRRLNCIKNKPGNTLPKEMIIIADSRTRMSLPLPMPNENFGSMCLLLEYLQNNFDVAWLKKMFLQIDNLGNSILHHLTKVKNCDLTTTFYDFFKANFDLLFSKTILLKKNNDGEIPFHFLLQEQNFDTVTRILNFIKNKFDNEFMKQVFFTPSNSKRILLHFAMSNENFDSISLLFKYLQDNFDAASIKKMFLQKDELGNNVLHILAISKSNYSVLKVSDFLIPNFDLPILKEILLEKSNDGEIPFHFLLQKQNNFESFFESCTYINDIFGNVFFNKIFDNWQPHPYRTFLYKHGPACTPS